MTDQPDDLKGQIEGVLATYIGIATILLLVVAGIFGWRAFAFATAGLLAGLISTCSWFLFSVRFEESSPVDENLEE